MRPLTRYLIAMAIIFTALVSCAQQNRKWVASWTGSVQGPYPVGNPSAQPDLSFVFPSVATGAREQTFRLIIRPDIWGPRTRLRFSNALGTRPVIFDYVFVGLQLSGAAVVVGTNRQVRFGGKSRVTVLPGESIWSDAVDLPFVHDEEAPTLSGRKLAVSFYIAGESGPMTWHPKALTTSYLTAPDAGSKGNFEDEAAFPFSTTSWYFLDAVDMAAPADTKVIVAFGDSITDGTGTTLNGDDRWPDVLSRRLHAVYGNHVSIVNAGIGGNQVVGPAEYSAQKPFPGGPSAGHRLERDVLSLSGVSAIIWLEGINDFSKNGNASTEAVQNGMKEIIGRIRTRLPSARIIGATVISALGSTSAAHGFEEQDRKRKLLNNFIRNSNLFDKIVDFDKTTLDPRTGGLRPEFVPDSTIGGPGDKLHPNRAGYAAMGTAIDLKLVMPKP